LGLALAAAGSGTASGADKGVSLPVPGPVVRVTTHLGVPTFLVDGQPFLSPVFETYVPETRYFKDFAAAGCRVYSFSTNLGDGFGPPLWTARERWDFSSLDARARAVLDADPRALIIPRVLITAPEWWLADHPDEVLTLDDGSRTWRGRAYESCASEAWRRDMAGGLRRIIDHVRGSPWGGRVFGYMLTGMATEEWYHRVVNEDRLVDYSRSHVLAFRRWLRTKYKTDEALRRAWNDPAATIDGATIPSRAERIGDSRRTFRDPRTEMRTIDFYLFHNEVIPETINYFARAARRSASPPRATSSTPSPVRSWAEG
jgi:hypothetical protein